MVDLTQNQVKILMQALVHLQQAIARRSEHICSEQEAEDIKVKLWDSISGKR